MPNYEQRNGYKINHQGHCNKRTWRMAHPKQVPDKNYTSDMYERAFGHEWKYNVMKRAWKFDGEKYVCYKCGSEVKVFDIECSECKADIDRRK